MNRNECSLWALNWSRAMPDYVVRKVLAKKVIDPTCLSDERRKRLGLAPEKEEAPEAEK